MLDFVTAVRLACPAGAAHASGAARAAGAAGDHPEARHWRSCRVAPEAPG